MTHIAELTLDEIEEVSGGSPKILGLAFGYGFVKGLAAGAGIAGATAAGYYTVKAVVEAID